MSVHFYNNKVCLNVLAGDLENAKNIYMAAEKNVVVGVLTSNYSTYEEAIKDMKKYNEILEGNLSVGLGAGNPNQWKAVAEVAKEVKANNFNQTFTAVSYTRACVNNDNSIINVMVRPSGKIGYVNISTGPLSSQQEPAVVPVKTAIAMAKDMGGNSLKFFPMGGLKCKDELIAVAKACAEEDFMLEPTGGIDLENYEEILKIILNCGVKKVIPHIYSSIINKETGCTNIDDVKRLLEITKKVVG